MWASCVADIFRWVEWKEKAVLDASEYTRLVASWERKLRTLSRKLRDTGIDDEEALDSRLAATRRWIRQRQLRRAAGGMEAAHRGAQSLRRRQA